MRASSSSGDQLARRFFCLLGDDASSAMSFLGRARFGGMEVLLARVLLLLGEEEG